MLLLLLSYLGIEPLLGMNELAREAQIVALELLKRLLVFGKLATDAKGLKRHIFGHGFDLGHKNVEELFILNKTRSIVDILTSGADCH